MVDKKNKRKYHSKKHSSSCHSSKRPHPSSLEVSASNVTQLFTLDLTFFMGNNIALSPVERGVINATTIEELAVASLEIQSRALAFTKVLCAEVAKGFATEMVTSSLKAALDANVAQVELLKKAQSERDTLRTKCEELEKEKNKFVDNIKGLE